MKNLDERAVGKAILAVRERGQVGLKLEIKNLRCTKNFYQAASVGRRTKFFEEGVVYQALWVAEDEDKDGNKFLFIALPSFHPLATYWRNDVYKVPCEVFADYQEASVATMYRCNCSMDKIDVNDDFFFQRQTYVRIKDGTGKICLVQQIWLDGKFIRDNFKIGYDENVYPAVLATEKHRTVGWVKCKGDESEKSYIDFFEKHNFHGMTIKGEPIVVEAELHAVRWFDSNLVYSHGFVNLH